MRNSTILMLIGLAFLVLSTARLAIGQDSPRGVPDGITKPMRISPSTGNGRNSEGDFVRLNDGRLLLVYTKFVGTGDHAAANLVGRYSEDGGVTWDTNDHPIVLRQENDANLMSVSLLRLTDGRIALFYIRKFKSPVGSNYPFLNNLMMRASSDDGKTWTDPIQIDSNDAPGYRVLNNDRVIQLASGRLVVPAAVHYLPPWPKFQHSAHIVCFLSDDHGETWRQSSVSLQSTLLAQEPGVVELADGKLLMFCRSHDCQLLSRSSDFGETWSSLERSRITQPTTSPASIERIPTTGDLLLVWNNGDDPLASIQPIGRRPFSVAVSRDEGRTWNHFQNLGTDPKGWYCYTAIEFVDDHLILAHCEFPGLNSLQITRVPIKWLYQTEPGIREQWGD